MEDISVECQFTLVKENLIIEKSLKIKRKPVVLEYLKKE